MIYLDHNATTPLDPRVLEAMLPFFRERFGNAASRQHAVGRRAAEAVRHAREQVAELLGADVREITFTSGATEANNLAIRGLAAHHAAAVGTLGRHIVTSAIEHPSVLGPCERLEREGWEVTYLDPTPGGIVEPAALAEAVRDDTVLISIQMANHEVGTLNDIAALAAAAKQRNPGVFFHTDATQAVGKAPVDVGELGVDLLSLSAHKFYGPQGIGALFARRKRPRVRLEPLLLGGGHEGGLRPGTANLPGIVGLGEAARIAARSLADDAVYTARLRDALEQQILAALPDAARNGDAARRLPTTTNLSLGDALDAEHLIAAMPELAVSSASACTTAAMQGSRVLRRMGVPDGRARASVRFAVGRGTTREEIDRAAAIVIEAVRNYNPAETACDPRL